MAAIYVHVPDMRWTQRYAALGCPARCADDVVVVCRTQAAAEPVRQAVAPAFERLKPR